MRVGTCLSFAGGGARRNVVAERGEVNKERLSGGLSHWENLSSA